MNCRNTVLQYYIMPDSKIQSVLKITHKGQKEQKVVILFLQNPISIILLSIFLAVLTCALALAASSKISETL